MYIILLLLIGANMREYIDDEGIRHADPLCFDEFGMIDRGVKAIKLLYGIIILLLLIGANMREYIDDEGIRHADPLCFDEFGMIDRGVKAIKLLYGITGALLLIGANMREYIDDEGIRHADPLCFDEFGMIDRGVKAIKLLYGITGAVGLIAGLALLFSPIKTLMVLATILGIYFIVASVVRIGVAIGTPFMPTGWRALNILSSLLILFCGVILATILGIYFIVASVVRIGVAIGTPFMPTGWRALNILSSLLILFCGVIMLRNQTASAAALATLAAIAIGFGWIIEGVVTLIETGAVHNRGLSILSGVLSIIAGIAVFMFPLESVDLMIVFSGIALSVLGGILLVRAFTFGKAAR